MEKLLITGGAGFIGGNFILEQLSSTNNQILNFDKLTYAGDITKFKPYCKNKNCSFVKGDICNRKKVREVMQNFKPDAIINFAAESHVDRSINDPAVFVKTNVLGTTTLLEEALSYYNKLARKRKKIFKFLQISSDEVFGELNNKKNKFTENSAYNPSSPYSASKASADHFARAWYKTYKLPIVITTSSNNYGPYQFPEKLIPKIIINAISNTTLPVYGEGKNIRDWLYVKDNCKAIEKLLIRGTPGETYNIGGNCERTNLQIVEDVCEILDKVKPKNNGKSYKNQIRFVADRPGHDYRYSLNTNKLENEINWAPHQSYKQGLSKTIKWYLENQDWWQNILSR
ncbi:MAG: dTDP-glucose 4,6-dehydratase [Candidatus Cloacimonetes bacterium]|nr:dTDP-glucose 4,6-dehydratase [Candidatus Cloacimonadota bacterium]